MSELKTNLEAILQEKQGKIIPGNIKKDVQIFDVIGTYEGSGRTDYNVKLFETEEEMQADSTAKEGDLAVVYRKEIQNMTSDTQTQYITFPETVTLPTAQGGAIARGNLIAIDGGSFMNQATYNLTSSTFSFNMYASSGRIQVQYESTDGITYTRTLFDLLENPVDLGTMMTPDGTLPDNCGYFMQVGGNIFGGLFECNNIPNPDTVSAYKFYKYIEENGERIPDKEDTEFTKEEVTLFKECMENSNFDSLRAVLIKDLDTEEYYVVYMSAAILLTSEKAYICGIPPRDDEESVDFNNTLYKVNTNTKTLEQLDTVSSITAIQGDDCWFGCPLPNMNKIQISKVNYPEFKESDVRYYANNNQWVDIDLPPRTNILKYEFAPSQLTAISNDLVQGKLAYGQNGVIEGVIDNFGQGLNIGIDTITPNTGYDGSYIEFKKSEIDGPFAFTSDKVNISMSPPMSQVAEGIGLTSDKLVSGNTILGIEGTATQGVDTSDATATANDIVEGKTAYVNGEKITGTLSVSNPDYNGYRVEQSGENEITLSGSTLAKRIYVNQGTIPRMSINMITLAEGIGLTADKIKAGETILGITGTYTGEDDISL